MRLWSLSPQYLDRQGLLAVWREGLLAKKVLEGKTSGYKSHPQLTRFKEQEKPVDHIKAYLLGIYQEAADRGYKFNREKAGLLKNKLKDIKVSSGQIEYEFAHLLKKLAKRDRSRYNELKSLVKPVSHPLFKIRKGGIELWEKQLGK
ncbi:MAG: pyrimidine dimer DNA glycosylase/endonuclease V [Patescibacteria group bacterium]|jgi:hypothetical protein